MKLPRNITGKFFNPKELQVRYTKADRAEMIHAARDYLRGRNIRPTRKLIVAQIAAEHGDDVAAMIETKFARQREARSDAMIRRHARAGNTSVR